MVEQSSYLFGLCHVSGEVITLDFSGNLLSILFVARVNEHLGAFPRERPGNGQADVVCGARHQCDFVLKQHLRPPNIFVASTIAIDRPKQFSGAR